MHAILMLFYAVGVVLFAAALALALVCWVIDESPHLARDIKGKGPGEASRRRLALVGWYLMMPPFRICADCRHRFQPNPLNASPDKWKMVDGRSDTVMKWLGYPRLKEK